MLSTAGCSARPGMRTDAGHLAAGKALVERAVAAQGGMARYRALGGVRLHLHATGPYYPTDADYVLDPARNRGAMSRRDRHGHLVEWRYDGHDAVELRDGRCVGGAKRGRWVSGMLSSLLFWLGTPWKFLDPGAQVSAAEPAPLTRGARPAPRFFVFYRDVGDTPDDWYLVSLDPATDRVARIVYLVSGFTRVIEMAGEWSAYEEVGGFQVATRRDHHPKNAFWHALAPNVVHSTSGLRTHEPLKDALFSTTCPP